MKTFTWFWILGLSSISAYGQRPGWDPLRPVSLKGLSSLAVSVSLHEGEGGTGAAAEKVLSKHFMLDHSSIQTEVELRLRQAGIKVVTASPQILQITVMAAGEKAVYTEAVLYELASQLTLTRDSFGSPTPVLLQTWIAGYVMQDITADMIRAQIQTCVSKFINNWLEDNPAPPLKIPTKTYQ